DLKEKGKRIDEDSDGFFRAGMPFIFTYGLLYNIRTNGTRSLCVPHNMIGRILEALHDEKQYFADERMLYDLRRLSIHNKTYHVKEYV
ncbi:hypothetical protein B0T26DRAFT_619410, partial [Lasiosphaeria miniovina]